ncbi:uncharacterized protein LOC127728109 [Mytilus californianus]|uniref:uncharacterized protein LOC127728109 n=1 Tax=Mytilus californianus TaxID=6549 RepID=UPI00224837F3|nr:uncharacterized protein LOC127728109 [Mytilus californianus]
MATIDIFVYLVFCGLVTGGYHVNNDNIFKVLEKIGTTVSRETCTSLSPDEELDIAVDFSKWEEYADLAIFNSNYLSAQIQKHGGSLETFHESLCHDLVTNLVVTAKPEILSGVVEFAPGVFKNYELFAAFAVNTNGTVESLELGNFYNYTNDSLVNEWYSVLRDRNYENVAIDRTKTTFRNGTIIEADLLVARRDDGHITKPYYDCGGGHVWMFTYSSPILGRNTDGSPKFKGVATIDIELTDKDINQCDLEYEDDTVDLFFNVFRGTHKCPIETTCHFRPGLGFKVGGYFCICNEGFYYQGVYSGFSGEEVEKASDLSSFRCEMKHHGYRSSFGSDSHDRQSGRYFPLNSADSDVYYTNPSME